MLAETPQGMADCPWDVRPHRQLGHWRLPSCPLVTQYPHGCPVPPQSLVCAPGKVWPCPQAPGNTTGSEREEIREAVPAGR